MSWDLSSNGSSSKSKTAFTAFPEGITRIRVVGEAPFMRWGHWWVSAKRTINCPGRDCPICEVRRVAKQNKLEQKIPMGRRFSITVINRETGNVEVVEQGVGFFEDILECKKEAEAMEDADGKLLGHSLQDYDLKVKRRGTRQDDTKYTITLGDYAPLTDAEKELAATGIDHKEYFKPHESEKILQLLNGKTWEEVFASTPAPTVELDSPTTSADEEFQVE